MTLQGKLDKAIEDYVRQHGVHQAAREFAVWLGAWASSVNSDQSVITLNEWTVTIQRTPPGEGE